MKKRILADEFDRVLADAISSCFGPDPSSWPVTLERLSDAIRAEAGGEYIYVPVLDKAKRNEAIKREFNGRNLKEVCARHGISLSHGYRVIGRRV